jgi:pimeloyl-ACP methyl ester carboxylesterase
MRQRDRCTGIGRIGTLVAVAAVAASASVTENGVAGARPSDPSAASVVWSPCHRDLGPFECGLVNVPLDHDEPHRARTQIAMVRLPARNPAERIGSLFINPGGPGGSGVDVVLFAGPFLFPAPVNEHFDLVGFDPRGVARSGGVRCLPNERRFWDALATPFEFPVTDVEEEQHWQALERVAIECDRGDTRLLEHMSTADVARDLDLLRTAVGDTHLNYFGVSYGSLLGNTYAQLFPERVRAMAIDAILDPIGYATGRPGTEGLPITTRLGSGASADATLAELFRLCDSAGPTSDPTGPGCVLAGDEPSAGRFAALAGRLREQPVTIAHPFSGEVGPFGYDDLIATTLSSLYEAAVWPLLTLFIAGLDQGLPSIELGTRYAAVQDASSWSSRRNMPRYPGLEYFSAVACLDSDNPSDRTAWESAAEVGDMVGYFTRPWTYSASPCAIWPFESDDRYQGPWSAETANPVLIMATTYDPATPFEGALAVRDLLPNSHLITVHGWGHVATGTSECAAQALVGYLIDVQVPSVATCAQDYTPFLDPPLPWVFGE